MRALAKRLSKVERQVRLRKQPGLAFSSIDDGAMLATTDGSTTMVIGTQYDGTNGAVPIMGPNPPRPEMPFLTPTPGGLRIFWDGTFPDGSVAPMDFTRVQAHAVPISNFVSANPLDHTTVVATFPSATGGEVSAILDPDTEYVVYLVTWTAAGRFSNPSDVAHATTLSLSSGTGVPGPPGADGTSLYTWIKYADSAAGAGMSDDPTGKNYIGLAFNKATAVESTTASDYQWSLFRGSPTDNSAPTGVPILTGIPGLLSAILRWTSVANQSPVRYEIAGAASTGFDPLANIITDTPALSQQITTLEDGTKLSEKPYYFRVRAKDDDGYGPWSSELSITPRLASNAEISADFAYLGEVSFNQLNGGTIGADAILGASMKTATTGARVEISPAGVNVHSTTGPRITLPTDVKQVATFEGSATMDGLTVTKGLEVRGATNRFTIGSKVVLETKTQGSASPPGVIVDVPKISLGVSPYIFGMTGLAVNHVPTPMAWTEVFFSDSYFRTPTTKWQPPKVGVSGYFDQRELQPYGGLTQVWDTTLAKWVYVVAGSRWVSQASGEAAKTGFVLRKYDFTPMVADGSVAPTKIGNDIVHAQVNGYLNPIVGRDVTDRTKFVTAEMSGATESVILRRWQNQPNATPTIIGSPLTTPAFGDYTTWFRSILGVVAGRAMDMDFHPTDTTDVYVVALNEAKYDSDEVVKKAYVFRASDGVRLTNYDFDLDPVEGRFFAQMADATTGGYTGFIQGKGDPFIKYTDITWTTEPSNWYAAYGWRASAGWKTNASVTNNFTMKKRRRLIVSTPPIPAPAAGAGTTPTADDANGINVYLSRGTGVTADLWLQTPVPAAGATTQTFETALPTFSGTNPPATSDFKDQASARFESSAATGGVPKFQLTGDGFAHFEALDITGAGASAFTGKAFQQLYYSIRAQSQLMGGGVKTVSSTYGIKWSQRFLMVSLGRSTDLATGGYFQIDPPAAGAVIANYGGATAKTVDASGYIPLDVWDALYYELPYGGASASIPGNFRVVNFTSNFVVPNNWVLIAVRNLDAAAIEWATGEVVDPGFDSDSPVLKQVILTATGDVNANAGNKPALRIGAIGGVHIRMDGNELQAMGGDASVSSFAINTSGGNVIIGGSGTGHTVTLRDNVEIPNAPTTTAATNVNMNGTLNRLRLVTSLSRFKLEQEPLAVEAARGLLKVTPTTWFDRAEVEENEGSTEGLRRITGVVAEDVEEHAPEWATYNSETGELNGVAYDRLTAGLLALVQDHERTIASLTERLEALESRLG